ncbi:DUF7210 family protein [Paenibacillus vini]|uniref:DUF7210 domain-containing protein n=1 Tax=Paenibacillus vini TaxID=1476024 RepID=A0ABQ4MIY5_9BACL|nr:hypothetical protein [Paenibacillus vini]GIP55953.1 hypothetical protein J42TS3_49880 [Paenibacillus vini]
MKVEVLNIPVRHNGSRYVKGESFSISEEDYERIKTAVNVIEQGEEPEFDLNKPVEEMKLDELKAHAKEKQIDLGGATRKEDILGVILGAQGGGSNDGAGE